jgi:hypothetical protein
MIFGVVYAYYLEGKERPIYIGKSSGCYSHKSVLAARHKVHLAGNTPFDRFLRGCPADKIDKVVVWSIIKETQRHAIAELKIAERECIQRFKPSMNVKLI